MNETPEHLQYTVRADVRRPANVTSFVDLERMVTATYDSYSKIERYISPYNAKQAHGLTPFQPPSKETIKDIIKRPMNGLHELMFSQMLMSSVKFCEKHKGKKQLPLPHPSTHHSAQFYDGLFRITKLEREDWPVLKDQRAGVKTMWAIEIAGATMPVYAENLKPENYKYLIIRPKLAKLGTASADHWEVLLFKKNIGYLIDHVDSMLNTRYAGKF